MKKVFVVIFCTFTLSLVTIVVPISSYGQVYQTFKSEIEEITKKARWRIGPFRIYPTIQFKDIGYDDNVYYQREEDGPKGDYRATISPEVKVYFLFRNYLIFTLKENPEYIYFLKEARERRLNNALSPGFKFLFMNRFVISGNYSYSNRRYRASSEFDIRANFIHKEYNGSIFYETPRGTSFGISASSIKISHEDITQPGEEIYLSRRLNRKEESASVGFYYRIFSQSFFFLKGNYTEHIFENKDYKWNDSYSYSLNAGIQFPILGRITGKLSLGYKELLPKHSDKKGFKGIVGDTQLNFRLLRFAFRLDYERDCRFSFMSENIYFIEDRYGAGISFYLTKFLRVDYNYQYGEANYPEKILLWTSEGNYEEIKMRYIYRIHTAGFVFRIIKNTGIGININFWDWTSNYYWKNRKRMFVGGYLTYNF